MSDTAAHLVDRVFPEAPVRPWVLSLPFALGYRLAYDKFISPTVFPLLELRNHRTIIPSSPIFIAPGPLISPMRYL